MRGFTEGMNHFCSYGAKPLTRHGENNAVILFMFEWLQRLYYEVLSSRYTLSILKIVVWYKRSNSDVKTLLNWCIFRISGMG